MKLFIAADHRGLDLKEKLLPSLPHEGKKIVDLGSNSLVAQDDYTDYVERLADNLKDSPEAKGLLICGSGIGMTIAANKFPGIIAALITNKAELEREAWEHGANVLVFSADNWHGKEAELIPGLKSWIESDARPEGRHLRRMNQIRFNEQVSLTGLEKPLLVPAILTSEKTEALSQYIDALKYAPLANFDFMDATITVAKTISIQEILEVINSAGETKIFVSVHLMTSTPLQYLEALSRQTNLLTAYIHAEADPQELITIQTKEWPFQLGLTFDSATDIDTETAKNYPVVQLMTVEMGAQGKPFTQSSLTKIKLLREYGYQGEIHLDGGLNLETIPEVLAYKPDLLAIGSALSKSENRLESYKQLLQVIDS